MEGSVCSCDSDTMQDELYSIHQSSAWLLFGTVNRNPWASFYLVNFSLEWKQTTIYVRVIEGAVVVTVVIFLKLWQNQKISTVY